MLDFEPGCLEAISKIKTPCKTLQGLSFLRGVEP